MTPWSCCLVLDFSFSGDFPVIFPGSSRLLQSIPSIPMVPQPTPLVAEEHHQHLNCYPHSHSSWDTCRKKSSRTSIWTSYRYAIFWRCLNYDELCSHQEKEWITIDIWDIHHEIALRFTFKKGIRTSICRCHGIGHGPKWNISTGNHGRKASNCVKVSFFDHPNLGFAGQFLKLLYVHNDVLSLNISSGSVWWTIYCFIIASICLLKCGPPIPSWLVSLNAYSYINHSCDWSLFNQLRYYLPPLHCISWYPLLN